jgi:hypothetical protein
VREHRGSPTLDNFRTTLSRFLRKCHRQFIEAKAKQPDPESGEMPAKKDLLRMFPYPDVELTPLGSQDSIHSFLQKFKRIESVTANLLETNSEFDNDGMFRSLRNSQKRMRSVRTSLHYVNKKQGLSPAETEEQLTVLSKQGNHSMRVTGVDSSGEKLEGNNDSFKVKIPIADLPEDLTKAASVLVNRFIGLKVNKIIAVPDTDPSALKKARAARPYRKP